MIIGIYSRKSIFSDKSDSTATQIKICKEYTHNNYSDITGIVEYEDEGFTGANTNRPGFTQLMTDVLNRQIDVLVCYKIDRISRNVLDFSRTFNILQEHGVQFISVKEQIDTSTPLGRAMMYICSVFAQMERETIAERVRDNSLELAKSGKWPGGQAPIGYKREKIVINGKKHTTLVKNEEELPFLNMIFDKFLEGYSLGGLETYFRKNNIKTLNGNYLSTSQLHNILKTPHGVAATPEIYDYFNDKGCLMDSDSPRERYDGKHGLLVYGRTNGGKKKLHTLNTPDKWRIAIGLHAPIIEPDKWLAVQARFGHNKIDKTRKHNFGILKGTVKCKCGYTMRVQHKVDKTYNKTYDNYYCQNRNRRGIEFCNMKMVHVEILDSLIIDTLKQISVNKKYLETFMSDDTKNNQFVRTRDLITNDIKNTERKIKNLTMSLQENFDSSASKYIISDIERLDKQMANLNFELREYDIHEKSQVDKQLNLDDVYNKICYFINNFDSLEYEDKTKFIQETIQDCIWNGEELLISF